MPPTNNPPAAPSAAERESHALETRVDVLQRALTARTREVIELRAERALRDYFGSSRKTLALVRELDRLRNGWAARLFKRWDRTDPRAELAAPALRLADESLRGLDARRHRLRPSVNLQGVPFVHYRLPAPAAGLCGIQLAVLVDLPHTSGVVGIEVVCADRIVVHATAPLSGVRDGAPTGFGFAPFGDLRPGPVWLRVFTSGAETPVRVLEWSRFALWGLGPERRRAVARMVYTAEPGRVDDTGRAS